MVWDHEAAGSNPATPTDIACQLPDQSSGSSFYALQPQVGESGNWSIFWLRRALESAPLALPVVCDDRPDQVNERRLVEGVAMFELNRPRRLVPLSLIHDFRRVRSSGIVDEDVDVVFHGE